MITDRGDDLVPFQHVRVIRSTASPLPLVRLRTVWANRGRSRPR